MAQPWYIYGAGGLGLETIDILNHALRVGHLSDFTGVFIEDDASRDTVEGFPIVALEDCAAGAPVTIAVGEPAVRRILAEKSEAAGLKLASLLSPDAFISPMARIEPGVIVAPKCSVQARASIARNAAVNTMAIVGHDVAVSEGAVISSMVNLGGAVQVGAESFVGMSAAIKEGLTIGARSIVGMGSVVYKDVPDDVIALGNPARVARRNEDRKVFG